jgi:uroporphyrinogen III methyltransferase / synthase
MAEQVGKVYLVGAGPGAPDLITVRGASTLGRAQVVLYDSLVSPDLLRLAPPAADLIPVGKRGGGAALLSQEAINQTLVERARAGHTVVRLKGGDPFIFGRGGEEAAALAQAGIAFEVVPGITSAIAAPALAGIPLTHREHGSFVAFVTGHEELGREPGEGVPWEALARAAHARGTLVILMAAARLRAVLERLTAGGLPDETPAAAIHWASTAAQRTVSATLASLADTVEREGLGSPAVVVVGECARLRERLAWIEKLPLFGRRIVVTRATEDADDFAARLRALGAEVIGFPTFATVPPSSFATLDKAIGEGNSFDWLIFTSARGVDAFIARLRTLGRDVRTIGAAAIAAIGPATAARLQHYALQVMAMPAEYRAEAILDAIGPRQVAGARFLIPRAEVAREILPQLLRERGAREVVIAPAYRTVIPTGYAAEHIRALIASGVIDLVTFTSSSTVTNFIAMVGGEAPGLKAVVIGPITAATARERGFNVVAAPSSYTIEGLIRAIVEYCRRG